MPSVSLTTAFDPKSGQSAALQAERGSCAHCGRASTAKFCCAGCETVYGILRGCDLLDYYALREKFGARSQPLEQTHPTDPRLEDPEFLSRWATGEGHRTAVFFLENLQCAACLWLLEQLPRLSTEVESVAVDFSRSQVHVRIQEGGSFARVASLLRSLGYPAHAVSSVEELDSRKRAENQTWLLRLGVAGFAAGNLMVYAFAVFAGATGKLAAYFNAVSFLLCIPVVFYSAVPLWRGAWAGIRNGALTVDVPIALALWVAFSVSVVRLFAGDERVYFDSVAALVFLLLGSRYFLRRLHESASTRADASTFLQPVWSERWVGMKTERVLSSSLSPGDRVFVPQNSRFPVDGRLESAAEVGLAFLTGESLPQSFQAGDPVYSGCENVGGPVTVRVDGAGRDTRLSRILREVERLPRGSSTVQYADRAARILTGAVLLAALALGLTLVAQGRGEEGLSRALALLIVTCPCALALATPLAHAMGLSRARSQGLFIRDVDALEAGAEVDRIVLDKTGTITEGALEVRSVHLQDASEREVKAAVLGLEKGQPHPVARALVRWSGGSLREVTGSPTAERLERGGVRGRFGAQNWEVRPERALNEELTIVVQREGKAVARIELEDRVRPEASAELSALGALGFPIEIASGDQTGPTESLVRGLGGLALQWTAEMTPEEKSEKVARGSRTMMVGDGVNDALALKRAYLGFAVQGSAEVSLQAAGVYSIRPGLRPVRVFLEIARRTRAVTRRNLVISTTYNVAGGIAAALGWVTPVFASVIMPVAALSVFLSTLSVRGKLE